MTLHPLAGRSSPPSILVDPTRLVKAYFDRKPDPTRPEETVVFGTSGHRGSSLSGSFNEAHILAASQAVADVRREAGIDGPLFMGRDTHALSAPALDTAVEVLAANGVHVLLAPKGAFTPTPAVSHAILVHNLRRTSGLADGIVVTPSHNPPEDGGFKYDPPHGGPAESAVTSRIQSRANALLADGNRDVRRISLDEARRRGSVEEHDFVAAYVGDLGAVIDMEAIRRARPKLGVDPLGGASVEYWGRIREAYGLNLSLSDAHVDPTFSFMPVDHDGKIRMDCSSPYAMRRLIDMKDRYDVAFGNDPDADRHGIVTKSGLMNPNHFLAVCASYLFRHRPGWRAGLSLGKTLVSSSLLDRIARDLGAPLLEVPVGFKWFVAGLADGSIGFAGEESAGASFLRLDGSPWTTDKDGIIACLLAAEIIAKTGRTPSDHYAALTERFGAPVYSRMDAPATRAQKQTLEKLSESDVTVNELAGERILEKLTRAPGNGQAIGGLKVVTENGWFAARPSGTEDVYKIYAESFRGPEHLGRLQGEARALVNRILGA